MRLCGFGARVMAVGADSFSRESMDGAGEPHSFLFKTSGAGILMLGLNLRR